MKLLDMLIRKGNMGDVEGIYNVYREAAKKYPQSLTQHCDELYLKYIEQEVIQPSLALGLLLVAENKDGKIVGSFKSYTSPFRALAHIMSNTTLVTSPDHEGKEAFVLLMKTFSKIIKSEYPHVYKVDGIPHESNTTAIKYYLKNGYKIIGKADDKIFCDNMNDFDNEVHIVWINPNFSYDKLLEYHEYLKNYLKNRY